MRLGETVGALVGAGDGVAGRGVGGVGSGCGEQGEEEEGCFHGSNIAQICAACADIFCFFLRT